MKGILANSKKLLNYPVWSGTHFTYNFYSNSLPTFYQNKAVPFPERIGPGPAGPAPLYSSVFDSAGLNSQERAAVGHAFGQLASFLNVTFAETASADDATFGFGVVDYVPWDADPNQSTAAWASPGTLPSLNTAAGDVWFAHGGILPRAAPKTNASGHVVIRHEMAHALGLAHSEASGLSGDELNVSFSVMGVGTAPFNAVPYEYQLYDVASLQFAYGPNDNFNSGDSGYGWWDFVRVSVETGGGVTNRLFSLWDAGGVDSIVAKDDAPGSPNDDASYIDLRPGHFSSIGNLTRVLVAGGRVEQIGSQNVSVAFGTYIENAEGTDHNDVLIGNKFTNELRGGDGDDLILGSGAAVRLANSRSAELEIAGGTNISEDGDGEYGRVVKGGVVQSEGPDEAISSDKLYGGAGNDIIVGAFGNIFADGGAGDDKVMSGDGDDELVGGLGDDKFFSSTGTDIIWGGDKDAAPTVLGGTDTVTYSNQTNGLTITFAGGNVLSVQKGSEGTDTLRSIEKIVGSDHDDTFSFSGSIQASLQLRVEAGAGQTGNNDINLGGAVGSTVQVRVTDDGLELTPIGGGSGKIELIGFSYDAAILGSNAVQTKFVGAGKGHTFKAGAGGGDFTLMAGDKAYGHEGVVDIFRVTTTAAADAGEAPVEYLTRNKVFIANFGAEDQIYVNGVLFNGNRVTSTLTEMHAVDSNRDFMDWRAVQLTGDSSYGTSYAQSTFEQRGWTNQRLPVPYGAYVFAEGRVRDVSYQATDDAGTGLITFLSRTIANSDEYEVGSYTLGSLSPSDEQLTIVIEGFSNGEGGITFANDALANVVRPTAIDREAAGYDVTYSPVFQAWDDTRVSFIDSDDTFRTIGPGGALIGTDDPDFNHGRHAFEGQDVNWSEFVRPPRTTSGTALSDTLTGGWAADQITGDGGDDVLRGGPGDDLLDGGSGNDLIYGEQGADTLLGGDGADSLDGGRGDDAIDGGGGTDTARYGSALADYRIYVRLDGTVVVENRYGFSNDGTDTLAGVEFLHFAADDVMISTSDLPRGSSGVDILGGSARDDALFGGAGSDTLTGLGGNDWLDGGAGSDLLQGGEGDDLYEVDDAQDVVVENADEGEDIVSTSLSAYTLAANVERLVFSGTGGFTGTGNALDNTISGGNFDDVLSGGAGYDIFHASRGNDVIDGGSGGDEVIFSGSSSEYSFSEDMDGALIITRGADITRLYSVDSIIFERDEDSYNKYELLSLYLTGTSGGDVLTGNLYYNNIFGLAGDDRITGGAGRDRIDGGSGNDTAVYTGPSAGFLVYRNPYGDGVLVSHYRGSTGTDVLIGVEHVEFADLSIDVASLPSTGTAAADIIVGGSWGDYLIGNGGDDDLSGLGDDDVLIGDAGNDILRGGGQSDTLYGGEGADLLDGGADDDLMYGGPGDDVYIVDDPSDRVEDFAGEGVDEVRTSLASYVLPENVERLVYTGAEAALLTGNASDNVLTGGALVDIFRLEQGGADTANGAGGDDGFYFGGAMDSLDVVDGGSGALDQIGLQGDYTGARSLTLGANQLYDVEFIVLLSGTDSRFGGAGGPYSYSLTSHDGNVAAGEFLVVQANTLKANEVLVFDGSAETDGTYAMFGGAAADTLIGSSNVDKLISNGGADRLEGRGGADRLRGGEGGDLFIYRALSDSTAAARDWIQDFTTGDLIDLSAVDGNTVGAGRQDFVLINSGAAFTAAGQLRITQTGGEALVEGDSDGDGAADFAIQVTVADSHGLTIGDFAGVSASQSGLVPPKPDAWGMMLYPTIEPYIGSVDLLV